jgi:hypothetical protein
VEIATTINRVEIVTSAEFEELSDAVDEGKWMRRLASGLDLCERTTTSSS